MAATAKSMQSDPPAGAFPGRQNNLKCLVDFA
jgi:hypothetical protein